MSPPGSPGSPGGDHVDWEAALSASREPAGESSWRAWPQWYGEPVSWGKLRDIEAWLAAQGDPERREPGLITEAELQLAEGRVLLSQREDSGADRKLIGLRLNSAEAGFRRVLSKPRVSTEQRHRAEAGMNALARMRGTDPIGASPTNDAAGISGGTNGHARAAARASAAPRALRILNRERWGAAPARPARLTPNKKAWNRITIHHSAKHTRELGRGSEREVADTLRKIQRYHFKTNHWGDIGYHFLIDPQGRIWQGRSLAWQGAHADGNNNIANIGVCLLGNFVNERPDPRALASLEGLINALRVRHRIPETRIYGHDHFKATDCPGAPLTAWLQHYKKR